MNLDLFDAAWTTVTFLAACLIVATGYLLWRGIAALWRRWWIRHTDARERRDLDYHLEIAAAHLRYQHRKEQQK